MHTTAPIRGAQQMRLNEKTISGGNAGAALIPMQMHHIAPSVENRNPQIA